MKIYYRSFFLAAFTLLSISVYSQGILIKLNYAPSLPMGSTADFTGNFSGRGYNIEFFRMTDNQKGFGAEIGNSRFFEEVANQTINSGSVAVHGNQFRSISITPLLLQYIFIFNKTGPIRPYVTFGAGLGINTQRIDMGVFVEKIQSNQFTIKPELGMMYELSDYVAVKLSGKYYQSFENSAMNSQSMLGINIGFVMLNFSN